MFCKSYLPTDAVLENRKDLFDYYFEKKFMCYFLLKKMNYFDIKNPSFFCILVDIIYGSREVILNAFITYAIAAA